MDLHEMKTREGEIMDLSFLKGLMVAELLCEYFMKKFSLEHETSYSWNLFV